MINLTHGRSGITVEFECLRNRQLIGIFWYFFKRWLERIDSSSGWSEPKHDRGSGRIAYGSLAMGIGKQSSPCRQPVEVRGLDLRMPAQATDPVVEVVDGQEQDVGL